MISWLHYGLEQMRGWFKGYFRGSRSALFFGREMCDGYFNGYFFFLVNHDLQDYLPIGLQTRFS